MSLRKILRSGVWTASASVLVLGAVAQTLTAPTFNRDIAPIVHRKCTPCHTAQSVGPFELRSYADFVKHAPLVRIQSMTGAMPPAQAFSDYGELSDTPRLTDAEVLLLQKWFQAKMPLGDGPEHVFKSQASKWRLGVPQTVVRLPQGAPSVKAEGLRYWQTYAIDLPILQTPLTAVDIVPKSTKALRYAVLAVVPADSPLAGAKSREVFGSIGVAGDGVIGVWAPGFRPQQVPVGNGRTIPRGSKLVVMAHWQPTGKPESPAMEIGLYTSATRTVKQARTVTLIHAPFEIPAKSTRSFSVRWRADRDTRLYSLLPEARFFCSKVAVKIVRPGQPDRIAFETLRWDPYLVGNWRLKEPIALQKGTEVIATFSYNNDENCPANDGKKPELVKSGNRLEDETCRLHLFLADR